jgi:cytochrome b561
MLQEKEQQSAQSNLYDSDSVYGWISILLHWVTAIAIIVLWLIGKSIAIAPAEDADAQRQLHVSIAVSAWLVILIRIVWRFHSSHPHIKGQTLFIHRVAKSTHYAMLIAVVLMLASGPVVVWSSGNPIAVFGWLSIAGPIGESESVREIAWFIHSNSALLLGALKHLMFHTDDTIVRMIWPGKQRSGADL